MPKLPENFQEIMSSSKDERLTNEEALLYQEYATKLDGLGFSEEASPESYKQAQKLIDELKARKDFDWMNIDWDNIDLKDAASLEDATDQIEEAVEMLAGSGAMKHEEATVLQSFRKKTGGVLSRFALGAVLLSGCNALFPKETDLSASDVEGLQRNGSVIRLGTPEEKELRHTERMLDTPITNATRFSELNDTLLGVFEEMSQQMPKIESGLGLKKGDMKIESIGLSPASQFQDGQTLKKFDENKDVSKTLVVLQMTIDGFGNGAHHRFYVRAFGEQQAGSPVPEKWDKPPVVSAEVRDRAAWVEALKASTDDAKRKLEAWVKNHKWKGHDGRASIYETQKLGKTDVKERQAGYTIWLD